MVSYSKQPFFSFKQSPVPPTFSFQQVVSLDNHLWIRTLESCFVMKALIAELPVLPIVGEHCSFRKSVWLHAVFRARFRGCIDFIKIGRLMLPFFISEMKFLNR